MAGIVMPSTYLVVLYTGQPSDSRRRSLEETRTAAEIGEHYICVVFTFALFIQSCLDCHYLDKHIADLACSAF